MPATTLQDRALLRLHGEDVRGFLQGLVTNDLGELAPGRPLWAGLLTPQGKALFDFILWDDGEDVLVDCEVEAADALAKRLAIYRLRRSISIAREDGLAVHWCAPAQAGVLTGGHEAGLPSAREHDPRLPELGHRWLAPPDEPATGWHAHRLSLGVTEGASELGSDKTLWLECNAAELNGVSFTKGCYVGQENTARMHHRSKVNRRLVAVATTTETPRTRALYPELGLAVEHRRVEELDVDEPDGAIVPAWLAGTLAA